MALFYVDFVYVRHRLFSNPAVGVGDWLSKTSCFCMCCVHVLYGCFFDVVIFCFLEPLEN